MKVQRFIAVEGNIGAGKTTLCTRLAHEWQARLVLEQFTDNPFLPLFYQQPERYALQVELFFMTERHKQLLEAYAQNSLFEPVTVADYFFIKTLFFAHHNLKTEEFRLFKSLFLALNNTFPKPDLLVYLHRPVAVLQQQIAKRGRSFEGEISNEYLLGIQERYIFYIKSVQDVPVLLLDLQDADLLETSAFERLKSLIAQDWPLGLTQEIW